MADGPFFKPIGQLLSLPDDKVKVVMKLHAA
jgi:hypothetical protein